MGRSFEPRGLTWARELRGLHRDELAARVGVTPRDLARLEEGVERPDCRLLSRLALAAGVPVGCLGYPPAGAPIPSDTCHFRHLRPALHVERRRALAFVALLYELFGFLDEYVELPAERLHGLDEAAQSVEAIDRCAHQVRKRWGLGHDPVPNVIRLLESRGVLVCPVPPSSSHIGSFSLWLRGRPVVGFHPSRWPAMARFEMAHELGHLLLHADVAAGSAHKECDADCFARAFLLPAETFGCEAPSTPDFEKYEALERRWGVPVSMLIVRAFELGCLPESSYRRLVWLTKKGSRRKSGHRGERATPIVERPVLLSHALSLLAPDWPLSRIAVRLSVPASDLQMLTGVEARTSASWPAGPISRTAEPG